MKINETYNRPDDFALPEEHSISHCTAETFRQLMFDFLKENLTVFKRTSESGYGVIFNIKLKNPHSGQYEELCEIS